MVLTAPAGILQPQFKYRFRVIIPMLEKIDENASSLFTSQVIDCFTDGINKKFNLKLRQPAVPGLINAINCIHNPLEIWVDLMNTNGENPMSTIVLHNCNMIKHDFGLDYASNEIASHDIVYDFQYMKEHLPGNNLNQKDDPKYGMTPEEAIKNLDK